MSYNCWLTTAQSGHWSGLHIEIKDQVEVACFYPLVNYAIMIDLGEVTAPQVLFRHAIY